MRKRSGQVHSRESSATLQLTVSLLYLGILFFVGSRHVTWYNKTETIACVFSGGEHEDKMRLVRQLDQRF